MVYSPYHPYLFANICEFFEHMNYNIMEAKVHTTQHGYALDSFLVMNAGDDNTIYRDVMSYIEYELQQILGNKEKPHTPKIGRVSRQQKHFPITPEVAITQDEKMNYQLTIIAGDRPGLLARIAYVLTSHNVEIRSAKINTLGARAEDSFWIGGISLKQAKTIEALREELKRTLS